METVASGGSDIGSYEEAEEVPVVAAEVGEQLAEQGLWKQMTEIVKFAGPAAGLWICGPLMSLIDTAVVGQGSSTELAALGTGTFRFLSSMYSNANFDCKRKFFKPYLVLHKNTVYPPRKWENQNLFSGSIKMKLKAGRGCP